MIYFIRHGLDDERFIGGWSDISLTPIGRKQVEETIKFLKEQQLEFNQIFSSDIERAIETAEMIQKEFDVPLLLDSRLREQNKGDFNGKLEKETKLKNPDFFLNINEETVYPNGESLLGFNERVRINIPYFLEKDNSLIITHRGVINAVYYMLDKKKITMDKEQFGVSHASVHEYDPKTKTLRRIF